MVSIMLIKKMGIYISIVVFVFLLSGCGQAKGIPDSTSWEVGDFIYKNQNEETVSLNDLKGKVWVANFIFTNCTTVCLPMTSNMTKLQMELKEQGIEDVQLVSFSVDPTVDTPAVLKEYGDNYRADYSNWDFLTGYTQETIEQFAKESFKAIVMKPEDNDQVTHGTSFYLVSQDGVVVKSYNGVSDFPTDEMIKHIKILQNY